jgi:drug/metabolite transporter (DMT)-like permease
LRGEGFIVIAAFVLSVASIYGKRVSQGMDVMVMTGYQLGFGGIVLLAMGYAAGATLREFTPGSATLLGYLAVLSAVAFTLWSLLLKYNQVGKVTVFNFLVPVFGAALSAICLNENIMDVEKSRGARSRLQRNMAGDACAANAFPLFETGGHFG